MGLRGNQTSLWHISTFWVVESHVKRCAKNWQETRAPPCVRKRCAHLPHSRDVDDPSEPVRLQLASNVQYEGRLTAVQLGGKRDAGCCVHSRLDVNSQFGHPLRMKKATRSVARLANPAEPVLFGVWTAAAATYLWLFPLMQPARGLRVLAN